MAPDTITFLGRLVNSFGDSESRAFKSAVDITKALFHTFTEDKAVCQGKGGSHAFIHPAK
jgi:hypothetical protein